MRFDLLIDAGNTRIKWALAAPAAALGDWIAQDAHMHADAAGFPAALTSTLAAAGAGDKPAIGRVLIANVAGPSIRDMLASWLAAPQLQIQPQAIEWFASIAQRAGVRNAYRNPAQLGCDRFAAAIGAHALCPGKAIVVANCGTATTIDALTPFRDFDDYWNPFLGGQGPAPTYVASLPEDRRAALREELRRRLPAEPDGSIHLTARAWAVRGLVA